MFRFISLYVTFFISPKNRIGPVVSFFDILSSAVVAVWPTPTNIFIIILRKPAVRVQTRNGKFDPRTSYEDPEG